MRLYLREEPSGSTGRFGTLRADGCGPPTTRARPQNVSIAPAKPRVGGSRDASNGQPDDRVQNPATGYSVDLLFAVIDLVPTGIIIVDEQNRVELTNRAAELVLQRAAVLQIDRDKRVEAAASSERHAFSAFLRCAHRPDPHAYCEGPSKFLFARCGLPVLSVTAHPFTVATTSNPNAGKRALLSLHILAVYRKLPVDNLRALYGLTPAEAQLASALAVGKTLAECSADRRVSINTTKTQLNALLAKTGLHRQVDLVRLLTAI